MQRITVKSCETKFSKDGSKKFYAVTDTAGGEFTSFDDGLAHVNEGAILEADVMVKGKYNNIQSFKLVQQGEAPKKAKKAEPKNEPIFPDESPSDIELRPQDYPPNFRPRSQSISIEGQVAFKELGEMIRANVSIAPQRVKAYWDIVDKSLYEWRGIVIKLEPAPAVSPTTKEVKTPPVPKESKVGVSKTVTPPDKIKPETIETIKVWWDKNDGALKEPIKSYMAKELKRVKISDLTEPEGQQLLEALKSGIVKEER